MFDSVEIAKKIKSCAKNKGIRLCDMLNDLGLGVNTISQLSAGKEMSFITFAKIADYLGVSVDELLGRSEPLRQASESEWLSVLDQMSDEDLKSMKSYAEFLISKQIAETKDLEKDFSERVKENGIQEE